MYEEREGSYTARDDAALGALWRGRLPGYPVEASARKDDRAAKARIGARDAIRNAMHALDGPRAGLTTRVELDDLPKAARTPMQMSAEFLCKRRESAILEGYFEIYPEPGAKKIAYAVWSTSTVAPSWKDGIVTGFDLKGEDLQRQEGLRVTRRPARECEGATRWPGRFSPILFV